MTTLLNQTRPSGLPLDSLAGRLTGALVRPGDPDYAAVATPWNVAVPSAPVAVVCAVDAADVVAAVHFAADHSLLVDARATGHGARTFGFASDRVRAIDVVTGDGRLRPATATGNPALF